VDVKAGATAGGKSEVFGDLKERDQVVAPASDELAPGIFVVVHTAKGSGSNVLARPCVCAVRANPK